jgi:hypothetical protein
MKRVRRGISVVLSAAILIASLLSNPAAAVGHKRECKIHYTGSITTPLQEVHHVMAYVIPYGAYWVKGDHCSIDRVRLILEGDGDFIAYNEYNEPMWQRVPPFGSPTPWYVMFQTDANFVMYDTNNRALWATDTCCHSGWKLAVQADGNVVIYDSDWRWRWQTYTAHS